MTHVLIIHGGDSFLTRAEYLRFLRSIPITRQSLKPRPGWKANLAKDLGRGWEVIRPTMPNDMNARYEDWKIWLDKYRPLISANTIFVGHSLGGIFLAKYLNERRWPKKIKALILVAAPHNQTKGIGDFCLPRSLSKLRSQVARIELFHSVDDPIVPFRDVNAYRRALPDAGVHTFATRGHFTQTHFPALVRLLKTF